MFNDLSSTVIPLKTVFSEMKSFQLLYKGVDSFYLGEVISSDAERKWGKFAFFMSCRKLPTPFNKTYVTTSLWTIKSMGYLGRRDGALQPPYILR